ncbi:MAG: energy-coupling factor transporter transmembrane protein EcfT [Clostridia bacterium]|nr:energy-coupling factor transporter transmembrane protein EcfT [Clostridia bacterium]
MRISLGRYIPGKSLFHKADPRSKIIWTIVMMVFILLCTTRWQYLMATVFVMIVFLISGIPLKYILKSLRPVAVLMIITTVFNLVFYKGTTVLFAIGSFNVYREALFLSIKMILRIFMLIVSASLLTYTTTSVAITDGIEYLLRPLAIIKFPAHEIAMMMSIALRFIPMFADETDKIIKAQSSRGAEFDSKNVFKKIKSYVPVLIPLFVGAFKSAEDMSVAMESRCYRGGKGRTKFKVLKFTKYDLILLIITAVFCTGVILMKTVFKI